MKILMSAFACEPNLGSEPELGWHWAVQASRFHEVWVLTHPTHRNGIENYLLYEPNANLHFVYIDCPAWTSASGLQGLILRFHYIIWQAATFTVAKQLHAKVHFDAAHHVTYCSVRYPTFLAWMDIPFIWGPLGGGERAPLAFYSTYGWRGMLFEAIRDLNNLALSMNPFVHLTARRARKIIAVTPETAAKLPKTSSDKVIVRQAIGMETQEIGKKVQRCSESGAIRLMYAGVLLHRKGVHLLLPAIRKVVDRGFTVHLDIYGSGPMDADLRKTTQDLGLQSHVTFHGRLARQDLLTAYDHHDVFVFPSLQDSGGFVVLEAMAAGLPVICLDLGGPAQLVTDSVGIRVPAARPLQVIDGMASAIQSMVTDTETRHSMAKAAMKLVNERYTWDSVGSQLQQLYDSILEENVSEVD